MILTDSATTSWGLKWRWRYVSSGSSLINFQHRDIVVEFYDDTSIDAQIITPEKETLCDHNQRNIDELAYLILGLRKQSKWMFIIFKALAEQFGMQWIETRRDFKIFMLDMCNEDIQTYLEHRTHFVENLQNYLAHELNIKHYEAHNLIITVEPNIIKIAIQSIKRCLDQNETY